MVTGRSLTTVISVVRPQLFLYGIIWELSPNGDDGDDGGSGNDDLDIDHN